MYKRSSVCICSLFLSILVLSITVTAETETDSVIDAEIAEMAAVTKKPVVNRESELELKLKMAEAELSIVRAQLEAAKADITRLESIVIKIRNASRDEKVAVHYNMGCAFMAGKLYLNAEQSFLKALEVNPDDAFSHYNLGVLYDDFLSEPGKARKHYESFIKIRPNGKDAAQVREWLSTLTVEESTNYLKKHLKVTP